MGAGVTAATPGVAGCPSVVPVAETGDVETVGGATGGVGVGDDTAGVGVGVAVGVLVTGVGVLDTGLVGTVWADATVGAKNKSTAPIGMVLEKENNREH